MEMRCATNANLDSDYFSQTNSRIRAQHMRTARLLQAVAEGHGSLRCIFVASSLWNWGRMCQDDEHFAVD